MDKLTINKVLVALLLCCVACGGVLPAHTCPGSVGPGWIGSDHEIDCATVQFNADLARRIMLEVAPDFGDAWIQDIKIAGEERWNCDSQGNCIRGQTSDDGHMLLPRSMFSLVHELGHAYMGKRYGTLDPQHEHWIESGQMARDQEYFRAYRPLQ